jgi:predicted dehydrogenase
VGVIGCGNISGAYMRMLKTLPAVTVVACADALPAAAAAFAEQHGVAQALTVADLLADPAIEMVLNLTTPQAHGEIALAALAAGKSVYNEKPLALTRAEGRQMLALAAQKGLRVGGAPDTFLGGGLQTCRELIDAGAIGTPVAATAFMMSRGHEHWHPNPAFYYKSGGGPMFDMGPYYLTALVSLLGPVQRVSGSTRITRPQRTVSSQPRFGEVIDVEVPTHVTGLLDFAAGPIATIITTFDVQASELPWIEIYGTAGTLSVTGAAARRRRRRLAGDPGHPPLHRQQPRPWAGGHGGRHPFRAGPSRQRRTGLPRARHHARHPRRVGGGPPYSVGK